MPLGSDWLRLKAPHEAVSCLIRWLHAGHEERIQNTRGLNTAPGRTGGQAGGLAQRGALPEASSAASPGVLAHRLGTPAPSRQHWVPLWVSCSPL